MTRNLHFWHIVVTAGLLGFTLPGVAADPFIIVQSTTSTQNSGLYDAILPLFQTKTGIEVRVVAVGTGQAIKNAANCDGDVLLVHAKADEDAFVANGYGVSRADLMHNDFVIIGPASDPASIRETDDLATALRKLYHASVPFVSRGDDSGTHKKELGLWQAAGIDPKNTGDWYRETGSGMGATLNITIGMNAHALTDRATWLAFENSGNHQILFEGDPQLFNQYGIILVNPEHCPNARTKSGQIFIDWMLSTEGKHAIESFEVNGEKLFFHNASRVE